MRTTAILFTVFLLGGELFAAPLPPAAPIPPESVAALLDPAVATHAYLASVPADLRERSNAYSVGGYWLILWNALLGLAINLLLLVAGWSVAWRNLAARFFRRRWLQISFYAVLYVLVTAAFSLPLSVYQFYFREHQYDMATQQFVPWFSEQITGLVVQLIATALSLTAFYAVCRHAPRTWWIWGAGVAVFLLMISNFIGPIVIEPLFNKYTPLTDPAVRDPILAMAQANQIPVQQVFEVDASRQTKRISANVAGLLGTARIALNDNLLARCSLPEIRFVMAHEMGHYVLNHLYKLFLYFAVFLVVGFALTHVSFDFARARWFPQVTGLSDIAGLPLLASILAVYALIVTPVSNTVIRVTEREADAFGLNCSREPDGFAQVSLKLAEYRKLDPGPVEEFVFFDHPSGRARIRMAMDWKAAHLPAGAHETRLAP